MAKADSDAELPGAYRKRQPVILKRQDPPLSVEEQDAADAAFQALASLPTFAERLAAVAEYLDGAAADDSDADRASDARYACHLLQWCVQTIDADPAVEKAIRNAFELGRLLERVDVRLLDGIVRSGRLAKATAREKGAIGKLTDDEWREVKAYIQRRCSEKASAAEACREAAAQLNTGKFPGVARSSIGASALQNRWTNRNKPAH